MCQALLSLVNRRRAHTTPYKVVVNDNISLDSSTICKEINEGIDNYITTRKALAPLFLA